MKSALERETCYENIKAVLCHFICPFKAIPKYLQPAELEYSTYVLVGEGTSVSVCEIRAHIYQTEQTLKQLPHF